MALSLYASGDHPVSVGGDELVTTIDDPGVYAAVFNISQQSGVQIRVVVLTVVRGSLTVAFHSEVNYDSADPFSAPGFLTPPIPVIATGELWFKAFTTPGNPIVPWELYRL
jgi:hypothetical protein